MNRKGFTTVELLLTMILVVIIMSTITSVTYAYRSRSDYEETLNDLTNYKNNLTKTIYDDILTLNNTEKIISMHCLNPNAYNFQYKFTFDTAVESNKYSLDVINETTEKGIAYGNGSNIFYYIIPGSEDGLVEIESVNYFIDGENNIYNFELEFYHRTVDKTFKINFTIS